MRHLRRFRTIPLTIFLLGFAVADPAHPVSGPDARLTVIGATATERALTDWVIGRFESAGLVLPSVTLQFRGDDECSGAAGLYLHSAATVTMCNRGRHHNPPRHTLLHELAHAWSLHAMDDGDVAAFLAAEGLGQWTGGDLGYWGQGAERVAEYVAWGLQDSRDEDRSIWTYGKDCADLASAYVLVTGSGPLNTSPGHCTTS